MHQKSSPLLSHILTVPIFSQTNINMGSLRVPAVLPLVDIVGDHNPLTMSDEQIVKEICATHVHNDTKFNAESLFTLVENILGRSTHVVDNLVHGNHGSQDQIPNTNPPAGFTSPLCTLKQISSEMSCKAPSEEIAFETTVAILNNLSHYSWASKPVLTLAAFALEYGDFWLLSQHMPLELATIKRVYELTKPSALQKHRNAILELNNLVKVTTKMIEDIVELEKCQNSYDKKDVPALAEASQQVPLYVFWAIITIAAIVTQIDCLTTNSEKRQELFQYGQRINALSNKLKKQLHQIWKGIEEVEYLVKLPKLFDTPTEIMEVFRVLIFWKDTPQAPIYDGTTKASVGIEVFKKKDVFLVISTLDISEEEISIFLPIYDHITKIGDQYKMVWVPIVEEWNDELKNKFESLKLKMPWYVLQYFAPIKGIKFIKENWHFKTMPMTVVLSPQGKILHHNAFHMIQVWGLKGFPFTEEVEKRLTDASHWIDVVLEDVPDIKFNWEEKDVIIYGGNNDWIQQFTKYASALANDPIIQEAKVSIELFCLESQQKNVIKSFWNRVENLFVTKMHNATNPVTQQVEKFLSYKNDPTGWALVTSKGPVVIFVAHGNDVLKTVADFGEWKKGVILKGFDIAFKEQLDNIPGHLDICSHLEINNVTGKLPDIVICPECHRSMKLFISYKCCHNGNMA